MRGAPILPIKHFCTHDINSRLTPTKPYVDMEKFSNYRDKATGISPFMPVEPPKSSVALLPLRVIYFILKLPLILAGFFFALVSPAMGSNFLLLIVGGLNLCTVLVDGVKKRAVDTISKSLPKPGDIVFANHITPMDGYIYQIVANRSVYIVKADPEGFLHLYSPFKLFWNSFDESLESKGKRVKSLDELKDRPIIILMEGTTSNNKGLLPFINVFSRGGHYKLDGNIKLLVIKINPGYLTLALPNITPLQYCFRLFATLNTKDNNIKAKIHKFELYDVKAVRGAFEENGLPLLANNLTVATKRKLIADYKESSS